MSRAGLIWNPKSHRNKGAGRASLPPGVLDIVPEHPAQLFQDLQRFASEGIDLVVIDGGDGTVREVISRLPEAFAGRLPRLGVVPNGKTNALAIDIGVPLGTSLEHLLAAADARRPIKRRACIEIIRRGNPSVEQRGFLFGLGAFVRATKLAQKNHGLGLFDSTAIAFTIAGAATQTLLGGPTNPWRRGEAVDVSFTGEGSRDWFLVLASTLKRFPLNLKPFGTPREGLKVLSIEAPARWLARAVPPLLTGADAPWLKSCGVRRDDLEAFDLSFAGDFVLDGEPGRGGDLTLRKGLEFEFVIP